MFIIIQLEDSVIKEINLKWKLIQIQQKQLCIEMLR